MKACASADEVKVVVRDFGQEIRPTGRLDRDTFQLGFGLIFALSSRFEIDGGEGWGTRFMPAMPLT